MAMALSRPDRRSVAVLPALGVFGQLWWNLQCGVLNHATYCFHCVMISLSREWWWICGIIMQVSGDAMAGEPAFADIVPGHLRDAAFIHVQKVIFVTQERVTFCNLPLFTLAI
jgi:hypothetical protein